MKTQHFRICVKAAGLDVKKLRGLEVLRISRNGHAIADARYEDIHYVTSFREWFEGKIAPKLERKEQASVTAGT